MSLNSDVVEHSQLLDICLSPPQQTNMQFNQAIYFTETCVVSKRKTIQKSSLYTSFYLLNL